LNHIDRLGLDYYIVMLEATCGVKHRMLFGDDGNGNSYRVDLAPLVTRWDEEIRRICGKGVIDYAPLAGSATNYISGDPIIGVEKAVETSPEKDAELAAKALALKGREVTYCLGIQDCRAIEDCLLNGTLGERNAERLGRILESVFGPLFDPHEHGSPPTWEGQ
jgi:hypothetical protein